MLIWTSVWILPIDLAYIMCQGCDEYLLNFLPIRDGGRFENLGGLSSNKRSFMELVFASKTTEIGRGLQEAIIPLPLLIFRQPC